MESLQLEKNLSRHLFIVVYRHLVRIFLLIFPFTSLPRLSCQLTLHLKARETFSLPSLRLLLGKVRNFIPGA